MSKSGRMGDKVVVDWRRKTLWIKTTNCWFSDLKHRGWIQMMMQGRKRRLCSSTRSFDDMHDLQVTSTSSKERPWGHACLDLEKHSVMLEWPRGWNGSGHRGLFLSNGWLFGWVDWPDLANQPWPASTRRWWKMDVLNLRVAALVCWYLQFPVVSCRLWVHTPPAALLYVSCEEAANSWLFSSILLNKKKIRVI